MWFMQESPIGGGFMKILVACETSGRVRDALTEKGHNAHSCDLLPSDSPDGFHWQMDVGKILNEHWDMMIAFPPCDHLAVSGARWFKDKQADGRQRGAIAFFMKLANASIERIAIENPIGIMSTQWRKPDQIIQPWQFGHGETKATCLWLKGLPKLEPTKIVSDRDHRVWEMAPSPDRAKMRGLTYQGIASAMADQWG